ncbi:precorrin-6A reductase [Stomatobaculum longum]|mgnify:CR=1 FL=1|uniref:precorrin-6A reductase n=1 Tax=Stomatobaculum longum TaxID=796942 RepID=UPI002804D37F|nr:precorrin-6A reductase [Stomatobaculum longum]
MKQDSENRVLLFGGTTEGRELALWLRDAGIPALSHVATDYGEALLREKALPAEYGRLDAVEMEKLFRTGGFFAALDATHPFATEVSKNIRAAAAAAGVRYYRILRGEGSASEAEEAEEIEARLRARGCFRLFDSQQEAADWLAKTEGAVFLATGSKELKAYAALPRERLTVRILPGEEALRKAAEAGIRPDHIVAMQGRSSVSLNQALLQQYGAKFLVTKQSGKPGGYLEKLRAAEELGICFVAIRRPTERDGYALSEIKALLRARYAACVTPERREGMKEESRTEIRTESKEKAEGRAEAETNSEAKAGKKQVSIVGIGPGETSQLTFAAGQCIAEAELIVGASRMNAFAEAFLRELGLTVPPTVASYKPEEIARLVAESRAERIVLLCSGDTGFFSVTKKLRCALADAGLREPVVLPGISSKSCLAARLGFSAEAVPDLRLHGKKDAVLPVFLRARRVFVILEGGAQLSELRTLASALCRAGAGEAEFHFGVNLSLPDETLFSCSAAELREGALEAEFAALPPHALVCLYLVLPDSCKARPLAPGIPDDCFVREKTPLTKRQIRAAAISLLGVQEDSICYDIGSGTGGMTAELAMAAPRGSVYAVECDADAFSLTGKNMERFALSQVEQVFGHAPEALGNLPAPDCVFVGGSTGKIGEIFGAVFAKNPAARVVATAVSLETVSELSSLSAAYEREGYRTQCLQLSAAETKKMGRYHLLFGQNPTLLFLIEGDGTCKD